MADASLDFPGQSVLLARLGELKSLPNEGERQLYREALAIFRRSQRLVPVDKGFLKSSGVIEGPRNGEVLIGYGGPAASYALFVHEDLEARHKPGKSAKFLEIPLYESIPGLGRRLAALLKKVADGQSRSGSSAPDTQGAEQPEG